MRRWIHYLQRRQALTTPLLLDSLRHPRHSDNNDFVVSSQTLFLVAHQHNLSQVKYVDQCRELFPPTLKGIGMKREAFWSRREVQDNQAKWEGHLETYELGKNGCSATCDCLGCAMDGEDTNF